MLKMPSAFFPAHSEHYVHGSYGNCCFCMFPTLKTLLFTVSHGSRNIWRQGHGACDQPRSVTGEGAKGPNARALMSRHCGCSTGIHSDTPASLFCFSFREKK